MLDNIRPINDKIIIEQIAPRRMSSGGLHIPDNAKDWPPIGTVKAIGPGRIGDDGNRIPMSVAVGDRVMFERRPNSEIEQFRVNDDERVLVLHDDDIVALVDEEGSEVIGGYNRMRGHLASTGAGSEG